MLGDDGENLLSLPFGVIPGAVTDWGKPPQVVQTSMSFNLGCEINTLKLAQVIPNVEVKKRRPAKGGGPATSLPSRALVRHFRGPHHSRFSASVFQNGKVQNWKTSEVETLTQPI